jgi:acylphosphatase
MIACYKINMTGNIQGKAFRSIIMYRANSLNLAGYVTYLDMINLLINIEGEETSVIQFLDWCKSLVGEGTINTVTFAECSPNGFKEFYIQRGQEQSAEKSGVPQKAKQLLQRFFAIRCPKPSI